MRRAGYQVWLLPVGPGEAKRISPPNFSPRVAAKFFSDGKRVVYISGEEAVAQVRMRARRLGLADAPVQLGAETNLIHPYDMEHGVLVMNFNGDPTSFGAGIACLGHPLHAVRWLAGVMARAGRPLGPGDVVLSGALGPMVTASPGDRFSAQVNGLGAVSVRFGKE